MPWRDPSTGHFLPEPVEGAVERALVRFRAKCQFQPETGCVVWIAGKTSGRGHNVPYGSFKFQGRRWFAHRWAAKFIHGLDIEGLQVDHCCPNIPKPNTLCVQHVQAISAAENRELQTTRQREMYAFLTKGLVDYEDAFGPEPFDLGISDIPFFECPEWLNTGDKYDGIDCPF